MSGLIPRKLKPWLIKFDKKEGRELQLLLCSYLIGRRSSLGDKWEIKRPFRLFIQEKKLKIKEE